VEAREPEYASAKGDTVMRIKTAMLKLALTGLAFVGTISSASAITYAGTFNVTAVTIEFGVFIKPTTPAANDEHCNSSAFIAIPSDSPYRDAMISMAYTALTSGLKLSIWVDGCVAHPSGTVPRAYHITITK
jgi:hypothetical protein